MNYSDERKLAPHVEPAWASSMVMELRLEGVAGTDIGAALSEVESHCAEGGVGAQDSFGDPVEYARSLGLPVDPRQEPAAIGRTVGPIVIQVAGMLTLLAALRALGTEGQVPVHVGDVLGFMVFLGVAALLVLASGRILRALVTKPIFALAGLTAAMSLLFIPAALRSELGRVPVWPVAAVGVLLLVGGVTLGWRNERGERPDTVTSPVPGARTAPTTPSTWLVRLMIPVATVILAAAQLILGVVLG
ncbi:MAG TPA: hypothetical protein VLR88_11650 [Propionibacteriaceae bacterium]|nr:hypothetical protein [Propionibacteriaceae bacterium]